MIKVRKKDCPVVLIPDIVYSQVFNTFNRFIIPLKMHLLRPSNRDDRRAAVDGAQIFEKKLPTLVWIVGGGFQTTAPLLFAPEMAFFARRGYQIAMIDYRVGGEGAFPAAVRDVKTAVRFLRAHAGKFGVDSEKIAVMGGSAGGYLAAMLGATAGMEEFETEEWPGYDSGVNAVIDMFGISDLSLMKDDYRIKAFCGLDWQPEKTVDPMMSPISHISQKTVPFLLLHGTEDILVPYKQSELLYETLQEKGVVSELVLLEGAGHASDDFWQEEIKMIILNFLNQNMG